jgi:hypothetical protein
LEVFQSPKYRQTLLYPFLALVWLWPLARPERSFWAWDPTAGGWEPWLRRPAAEGGCARRVGVSHRRAPSSSPPNPERRPAGGTRGGAGTCSQAWREWPPAALGWQQCRLSAGPRAIPAPKSTRTATGQVGEGYISSLLAFGSCRGKRPEVCER